MLWLLHGFGGGDLGPARALTLPPWVAWVAGAAVVGVSFVLIGAFLTREARLGAAPRADEAPRSRAGPVAGLVVLLAACAPAFWPASASLLPKAILWVVLWSGLPIAAYAVAGAYELVNPMRALAPLADRLRGRRAPLAGLPRWGAWLAVAGVLAFVGLEVWSQAALTPASVARIALAYVALQFAGMAAFGGETWLSRAEPLTRTFALWSACAPWAVRGGRVRWRGLDGLRSLAVRDAGDVALVVAVVYGVNFDGFLSTPIGDAALTALEARLGLAPGFVALLLAGYAAFLAAFWACARAVRSKSESLEPVGTLAARFAASLLPIAVGYHFAHNLLYVVAHSPRVLLGAADPLGLGSLPAWSSGIPLVLLPPQALLDALPFVQLALIVAAHVVAVTAAHRLAVDGFASRMQAVRSEIPLTAAMVAYTIVGLWIVTSSSGVSS